MRALFVYSDQRSSSSFRTLSNEELSRFSVFFIIMIFCQNQTCCLSRVCRTCDFGRRGNWWIKDAISDNWHDWKRIHLTSSSTPPFPSLSPSLLYNYLYHCIRHSSGKGLLQLPSCTSVWLKNWPLVPLFVCFGDRWIHLNKKKEKKQMLWYLPSVFKVMSLWVTQPNQGAMMDLDAVTRSWKSPVQATCISPNETE